MQAAEKKIEWSALAVRLRHGGDARPTNRWMDPPERGQAEQSARARAAIRRGDEITADDARREIERLLQESWRQERAALAGSSQQFGHVADADELTLGGNVIEDLDQARRRVDEQRKLKDWRATEEERVVGELQELRASTLAEIEAEIDARREDEVRRLTDWRAAEESKMEQWKLDERSRVEAWKAQETAQLEAWMASERSRAESELGERLNTLSAQLDRALGAADALAGVVAAKPKATRRATPKRPKSDPRIGALAGDAAAD